MYKVMSKGTVTNDDRKVTLENSFDDLRATCYK